MVPMPMQQVLMVPVPVQQVPMPVQQALTVSVLPVPVMRLAAMMGWSLAISASIHQGLAYALYAPAE